MQGPCEYGTDAWPSGSLWKFAGERARARGFEVRGQEYLAMKMVVQGGQYHSS